MGRLPVVSKAVILTVCCHQTCWFERFGRTARHAEVAALGNSAKDATTDNQELAGTCCFEKTSLAFFSELSGGLDYFSDEVRTQVIYSSREEKIVIAKDCS